MKELCELLKYLRHMNLVQGEVKCPFFYMLSVDNFRKIADDSSKMSLFQHDYKTMHIDSFCECLWNYT